MSITNENVVNFINEVQPLFPGLLGEIQKDALEKKIPIIPPETARFLATFLSVKKCSNILEVGCAIGFSSALMSQYLEKNGTITTIDRFDVMIKKARENFKKMDIEDKITLIEGDACDIIKTLDSKYDLIFLDAAKGQYITLLPYCKNLLKNSGVIIADDILQFGRIALNRDEIPKRQRTIHDRMRAFIKDLTCDENFETSIVPIGDGLLIAHKK